MTGLRRAMRTGAGGRIAFALLGVVLLLRVLVPTGYMPAAGSSYAITLCTADGATQAWVDDKGEVHKGEPGSDGSAGQSCPFFLFASAVDLAPAATPLILPFIVASALVNPSSDAVSVGRGLAAPPPPATGPPASL